MNRHSRLIRLIDIGVWSTQRSRRTPSARSKHSCIRIVNRYRHFLPSKSARLLLYGSLFFRVPPADYSARFTVVPGMISSVPSNRLLVWIFLKLSQRRSRARSPRHKHAFRSGDVFCHAVPSSILSFVCGCIRRFCLLRHSALCPSMCHRVGERSSNRIMRRSRRGDNGSSFGHNLELRIPSVVLQSRTLFESSWSSSQNSCPRSSSCEGIHEWKYNGR